MADLSSDGNVPLDKQEFTMLVITGAITGRTSRSRLVGIGSRLHVALDAFLIMAEISDVVAGLTDSNCEVDGDRNEVSGGQRRSSIVASILENPVLILDILVTKNSLKISAKVAAEENSGRWDDFPRPSRLFTI